MQNILFFKKYIKIIFKKTQGTVVALKPEILVYIVQWSYAAKILFRDFQSVVLVLKKIKKCWCKFI